MQLHITLFQGFQHFYEAMQEQKTKPHVDYW